VAHGKIIAIHPIGQKSLRVLSHVSGSIEK
jgi:hypothetical protein